MDTHAVWATMEAKAGKEDEVRAFLVEAGRRIRTEPGTTTFYALDLGEGRFAVFNSFVDEAALAGHVGGEVARWASEEGARLCTGPFDVARTQVIASKTPND